MTPVAAGRRRSPQRSTRARGARDSPARARIVSNGRGARTQSTRDVVGVVGRQQLQNPECSRARRVQHASSSCSTTEARTAGAAGLAGVRAAERRGKGLGGLEQGTLASRSSGDDDGVSVRGRESVSFPFDHKGWTREETDAARQTVANCPWSMNWPRLIWEKLLCSLWTLQLQSAFGRCLCRVHTATTPCH